MTTATLATAPTRRERWAWYLYDFGNSAYASVVLLAVYSAYFKEQVVGGAEGTRMWGLALGIAMLVVALISPFLGAIADFAASKKRFLLVFTAMASRCSFLGRKSARLAVEGKLNITNTGGTDAKSEWIRVWHEETDWLRDLGR